MTRTQKTFREHWRISELCPIFDAVLSPNSEEGINRHFLHQLPKHVVVDAKGNLEAASDLNLAVIMEVKRSSKLLPHMEEDLDRLPYLPFESLYLALPVGDPVFRVRTRLLDEASKLFIDLAEMATLLKVVSISHRRQIQGAIVIRHYPVALFDQSESLLWAHPAGISYGLIRWGFPGTQKVRRLGPESRGWETPIKLRKLDDETGLPLWYRHAKEHLKELQEGQDPLYCAVIDSQAQILARNYPLENEKQALLEATRQFLNGFETFFGQGGLQPTPGYLDLA